MDKYKVISDVRDILPTIDNFLTENGNNKIKEELDPWIESNKMIVYEKKLYLNKDQMKVIKKYTFNLKAEKEQDYFFIQNESGDKDRVIWVNSDDYQSMQKQKKEKEKWNQDKEERLSRINKQIENLKKNNNIAQPPQIKIPSKNFEITLNIDKNSDRIDVLLKILGDFGVELLSSRTQPDGVKWYLLDRIVLIPNAWYEWLSTGTKPLVSFGFTNVDGLQWDWNQINVADENTYIQYKYNLRS